MAATMASAEGGNNRQLHIPKSSSCTGKEPIDHVVLPEEEEAINLVVLPEEEEAMCRPPLNVTPPPSYSSRVRDKIELTDEERLLFDFLRQVTLHFDLHTEIRIAGVWVRDKLLDRKCSDIEDVALDNMRGKEFCEKINKFFSSCGEGALKIILIQSKSFQCLETATMFLFDMRVDFVKLRSEDYTETCGSSRVLGVKLEEDAYLSDLTINSLFYNINTTSVEDFTGKDEELRAALMDSKVKAAIKCRFRRNVILKGNVLLFWDVFNVCPLRFRGTVVPPIDDGCDRLCAAYMDNAWRLMQRVGFSTFSPAQAEANYKYVGHAGLEEEVVRKTTGPSKDVLK
ncbi:nucleotidyltransferase lcsQ-like [Rhododendron vialii]|uniref:nucleotidyltransferase lcsQ-like n=1 Tax=Rhododendron vialii TaxID=182163 RepID=UPI00265DFD65|nr:nucleotidyltransferase lcsQ-like [Rhododendron vialii]